MAPPLPCEKPFDSNKIPSEFLRSPPFQGSLQEVCRDPGRLPELLALSGQHTERPCDRGIAHHGSHRDSFTDKSAGTILRELSLHEAHE